METFYSVQIVFVLHVYDIEIFKIILISIKETEQILISRWQRDKRETYLLY